MDVSSQKIIFCSILGHFLKDFEKAISKMSGAVVDATSSLYEKISSDLLPTPAKPHYTFNLRDFAKVIQGVMMVNPKRVLTDTQLGRAFTHEACRVFRDRMVNYEDAGWITEQIKDQVEGNLKLDWAKVQPNERCFYGNFMDGLGADPKIYDEIPDLEKLSMVVNEYLADYNAESKSPMNLVLFLDAIEHVSRIARVLSQPRGNVLLLGVGGSEGKV